MALTRFLRSMEAWKRQPEEDYLIEPVYRGRGSPLTVSTLRQREANNSGDDTEDEAIVSGVWAHKDDLYVKFGDEDWKDMDAEVDEIMDEDSDDERSPQGSQSQNGDDEWAGLDDEIEEALNEEREKKNTLKR